MIYLDNAATTFPKPEEVYLEMDRVNRHLAVNAGRGSYRLAQEANNLIEETRGRLRKLIRADEACNVAFSPSVTIALNQVVFGIAWNKGDVVYVSPFEHNAVARTLHQVKKKKEIVIEELELKEGSLELDIEKIKYQFARKNPKAVFCTGVSNVTGYVLPVEEIFTESKKYNAINVLDSAQSLGLIELDVRNNPVDIIAFAGHKTLYGPFGIGGFINVGSIPLDVVVTGGTGSDSLNLEMAEKGPARYEVASKNIVAIAGLNKALEMLNIGANYYHEKELTSYTLDRLKTIKNIIVYDNFDPEKHVGIISFNINGMKSEDVGMILDEDYDIAVRTGNHCAPFIHRYLKDAAMLGTVRIGLGVFNDMCQIDLFIEKLKEL